MEIGILKEITFPSPKVHSRYDSILRKSQSIANKLDIINIYCKNLNYNISEYDSIFLSGEIGDFLEKIYSCMEYVADMLRDIFRSKGQLQSSFHSITVKTLKNKDNSSVYSEKSLFLFVENTLSWYPIVHDIRSEEAHFSMRTVFYEGKSLLYTIDRNTGRETMYDLIRSHKRLPEDREVEYKINIKDLSGIYMGFIRSIKQLESLIQDSISA